MPWISRPRAATSVATRILKRPSRNFCRIDSRAFWVRLPCNTNRKYIAIPRSHTLTQRSNVSAHTKAFSLLFRTHKNLFSEKSIRNNRRTTYNSFRLAVVFHEGRIGAIREIGAFQFELVVRNVERSGDVISDQIDEHVIRLQLAVRQLQHPLRDGGTVEKRLGRAASKNKIAERSIFSFHSLVPRDLFENVVHLISPTKFQHFVSLILSRTETSKRGSNTSSNTR